MERTSSFRDYIREQSGVKPVKERKKKGGNFVKQVIFTLIIGVVIWAVIAGKNEYIVSMISNNIHYNVEYSKILEFINNIWTTLVS